MNILQLRPPALISPGFSSFICYFLLSFFFQRHSFARRTATRRGNLPGISPSCHAAVKRRRLRGLNKYVAAISGTLGRFYRRRGKTSCRGKDVALRDASGGRRALQWFTAERNSSFTLLVFVYAAAIIRTGMKGVFLMGISCHREMAASKWTGVSAEPNQWLQSYATVLLPPSGQLK